jgi:hypothetical protein
MLRKSKKSMEISRIQIGVKPYASDHKEIDKLIQHEFGGNQAECVRTLLREALMRRRLVSEGKDATMNIVKDSQAQVIDSRIQPLINQIDKLVEEVKSLTKANQELSNNVTTANQRISSDVGQISQQIKSISNAENESVAVKEINAQLSKLTLLMQPFAAQSEHTLKNIIAVRSLFYLFLLAYQSGSIEEAVKLQRTQWVYFVRDVHKRANSLAVDEFTNLDAVGQHKFIEDLARQLFENVRIIKESEITKLTNK